ncbi:MAG TPA: cobyric acid synthase [Bryobacteraceae bacterium]|nr:cobyric acid synthase [Bryobacteraceae bacterium]
MKARPIFVGGTASHAGKSWMATAICGWLRARGFRVAPFKAQNLSNNSHVCRGGGEIGRAQAVQAEACGVEPSTDMNPILLKPSGEGSQVVLEGTVWGGPCEYREHFDLLFERVLESYGRLAGQYEYIVIEGAGSVAELNLRDRDLTNLGLARRLEAPALLVADIDRGGVFASIVGTLTLLDDVDRSLFRSFAVNRFRGDPALFEDGVRILEQRTSRPCLGVFPMLDDAAIDAEDCLWLDEPRTPGRPRIAIVRLPHVSNSTDFRLLAPFVEWVTRPTDAAYDCIILPGAKSTIDDLAWMRAAGLDAWVAEHARAGGMVLGVCGGYQMMGESIEDPHTAESSAREARGLGLLPVRTVMQAVKTVRTVDAVTPAGVPFTGYEIHMGKTSRPPDAVPFAVLPDGGTEGIRAGCVMGTYLHGALESPGVVRELLGIEIAAPAPRQATYERLAEWFGRHSRGFEELYL